MMPFASPSRLGVLALAMAASISSARAQATVNPLEFVYDYPRIGGELGLAPTWQSGIYRTGCGEFVEGTRINPIVALAYDQPIGDESLRLEVLGGWMLRSVASRYNSREIVNVQTERGILQPEVDFENEGELNSSYFFVLPSMKYYVFETIYAGVGASAGFLTSATSQYTKTIISKSLVIPGLGPNPTEISYSEAESDDPYSKIFPVEERPDAQGFALDLAAYVGAEFKVGDKLRVGPRVLFAIPMTTFLPDPELKLFSLHLTIGVRYALFR